MAASNKSSFALKVFHCYIKDHATKDLLVADGHGFVVREDFKGLTDLFHLLGNGISPKSVAIFTGKFMGISYRLRYFDSKLVCALEIADRALLHHGDDAVMLLQHMWNPPVEGRLMVNASHRGKFSSLNWVGLFQVREFLPGDLTILPLAA